MKKIYALWALYLITVSAPLLAGKIICITNSKRALEYAIMEMALQEDKENWDISMLSKLRIPESFCDEKLDEDQLEIALNDHLMNIYQEESLREESKPSEQEQTDEKFKSFVKSTMRLKPLILDVLRQNSKEAS